MTKTCLFIFLMLFAINGFSQNKPAYVLYNAKGKKVSYKKMIRVLGEKDMVLIGEFHNNAISHWMEL